MPDRIIGANTIDLGGGRRGFQDENPAAGIDGTDVTAAWLNGLQEAVIADIVEEAGLTPDAAASAQVRQALRRLYGGAMTPISASGALTVDQAGLLTVNAAASPLTLTLPAAAAMNGRPIRYRLVRYDSSSNTVTVQRAGSDAILGIGASVALPPSGVLELISDGIASWIVAGRSVLRVAVAGVSYLPDGAILQYGKVTIPASGTTAASLAITYPVAFPSAVQAVVASAAGAGDAAGWFPVASSLGEGLTGCTLVVDTLASKNLSQAVPVRWMAIGK